MLSKTCCSSDNKLPVLVIISFLGFETNVETLAPTLNSTTSVINLKSLDSINLNCTGFSPAYGVSWITFKIAVNL